MEMSRKLAETGKGSGGVQDHTNMLVGVKERHMQMMEHNGKSRFQGGNMIANSYAKHFDIANMAVAQLRGRQASTNAHGSSEFHDEDDLSLSLIRYGWWHNHGLALDGSYW